MADIFDVIADATRRDLLQVLLDGTEAAGSVSREISVGEIVDRLGLSQPTVSKHLKVLRDIGVVSVREEGQRRFYRLDPAPLAALEDWLAPFLAAAELPQQDAGARRCSTPGPARRCLRRCAAPRGCCSIRVRRGPASAGQWPTPRTRPERRSRTRRRRLNVG